MVQLEDLIDELGGMGRYQTILTICVTANLVPVGWSMLFMSFAGRVPDFYCSSNSSGSEIPSDDMMNACYHNGSECSSFKFLISSPNVVSEWDLVCDKEWVKRVMITAQMAGVFVGAIMAGQLSDSFGRKKVLYLAQAEHTIMNFIAAISTSWPMLASCRFFIGLPLGAILVVALPYPIEFCPIRWRPLTSIVPAFTAGVAIFALGTYLLQSWSLLHVACGVICGISLLGMFFVPESIRWLATQNKIQQARNVLENIAKWNRRSVPENSAFILEQIAIQEDISREDRGRYTYMDIFRSWQSTKISLALCFFWFSMSTGYYGISFGVSSLSGNIHINIFLMALLETPITLLTMYFSNVFGRRRSGVAFFAICMLSTTSCVVIEKFAANSIKRLLISIFCFTAKVTINAAWSIVITWGPELYPTVTRYLGFGFANMGARVGGMLSPFIINFDSRKQASYGAMTGLFSFCIVICFFLPETKGRVLQDTFQPRRKTSSIKDKRLGSKEMEELRRLSELVVTREQSDVPAETDKANVPGLVV